MILECALNSLLSACCIDVEHFHKTKPSDSDKDRSYTDLVSSSPRHPPLLKQSGLLVKLLFTLEMMNSKKNSVIVLFINSFNSFLLFIFFFISFI